MEKIKGKARAVQGTGWGVRGVGLARGEAAAVRARGVALSQQLTGVMIGGCGSPAGATGLRLPRKPSHMAMGVSFGGGGDTEPRHCPGPLGVSLTLTTSHPRPQPEEPSVLHSLWCSLAECFSSSGTFFSMSAQHCLEPLTPPSLWVVKVNVDQVLGTCRLVQLMRHPVSHFDLYSNSTM